MANSKVPYISRAKEAEEDFKYTIKFLKPILKLIGAWPITPESSLSSRILQKVNRVITYFLFFFILIPCFLDLFLKQDNAKARLVYVAPLLNCGMQMCKYTILLCRMSEMKESFYKIKQDWINASDENRQIFRQKAKIGQRMMFIVACTMYGGGICYRTIFPFLKGTIVTADNITIKPLPCPSYFIIINEQLSPYYEITFALQICGGMVTYTVVSASCGMCGLLVLHTCSMLKILVKKMNLITDKKNMDEISVRKRIVDVVEYRVKIKQFIKISQSITEYICLTEALGGTGMMCLIGYNILLACESHNTTVALVYVTLLIACTHSIFTLCYIGQLLVDESNEVGETSRMVNWYLLQNNHAKSMILIIATSYSPMRLTAGKTVDMSLVTFNDVVKICVGYINILRNVI